MSTALRSSKLYKALVERDKAYDGVFVFGVKTTGIFCRPVCTAKKPRIENCEFFDSAPAAQRAGYRPCLRCRPLGQKEHTPPLVARLRGLLEQSAGASLSDKSLSAMGIEPTTARRQFREHYGMTFQAYRRAGRMGRAVRSLQRFGDLPRAMSDAGYSSWSGFRAAFAEHFGKPPLTAGNTACLTADWIPTPLGSMLAVADERGVFLLEFNDQPTLSSQLARLRAKHRAVLVPGKNAVLEQIARELGDYFAGKEPTFRTPLHMAGTPFQARVWRELLNIPPGQTASYASLARAVGQPKAVRAVGMANARNPLAIVVPCHRVVRSGGDLCGYAAGVWRKRWLLEHEAGSLASWP